MAQKLEALRGMEDILPGEIEKWQWLEEKARIFFEAHGFKEIRTPILELTDLFSRSVGESSDIVHKEMFSFEDRGGRNVTLRPEMTASVARSIIEKGLLRQNKSLRLYYIGPMFRAERPQAGRKRQFHQIGIEMVNESGLTADLECIQRLFGFLRFVGVQNPKIRINDLGDAEGQKRTAEGLRHYFENAKSKLCKDCLWRLEKNVLRIFDCKVEACQPVIQAAPWENIAPLSDEFKKLLEALQSVGVPLEIKRRLVRGLDYYNGAVFEATADGLGAQDALAGGGRYDRLYTDLGESVKTPCTGFSIGFERLLSVLEKATPSLSERMKEGSVYFAPMTTPEGKESPAIHAAVAEAVMQLRILGVRAVPGRQYMKLGDHFKQASKLGFHYVVILGPDEFQKKEWTVKNMVKTEQQSVKMGGLFSYFKGVSV